MTYFIKLFIIVIYPCHLMIHQHRTTILAGLCRYIKVHRT